MIEKFEAGTASPPDSHLLEKVFDRLNTGRGRDVFADRGYTSQYREGCLKKNKDRSQIERKERRNKLLSECQQSRNARIAKMRVRVKHVFVAIDEMGGKLICTIGSARANFAVVMMAICYNLKLFVHWCRATIEVG